MMHMIIIVQCCDFCVYVIHYCISGLETLVYADPLCPQVTHSFICVCLCVFRHENLLTGMQLLPLISYLHSCDPPIIHGNLTCDTIFIQHNGLIKIGSGIFYFSCTFSLFVFSSKWNILIFDWESTFIVWKNYEKMFMQTFRSN